MLRGKARPPDRATARAFMQARRDRFPGFIEALLADAQTFCVCRGERHEFRSDVDRLLQVLRLAWTTDAYLALAAYRLKASLQARSIPLLPRVLHRVAISMGGVCIGDPVVVEAGLYLPHGQVIIDGLVEIGPNVKIRPWVTVGLKEGDPKGATIERGVRVGTGAKVIGPVTIGARAHIGANAVVLCDVPAGATAVGVPARIIEPRSADSTQ